METGLAEELARDLDKGFERLVREHSQRLHAIALGLTRSREDAEEVAQDALIRAHRALRGYSTERILALAVAPWLSAICANAARNAVRARRRRPPADTRPGGGVEIDVADPAELDRPEAAALARSQAEWVRRSLAGLPGPQRLALALHHLGGLRFAEVAQVMEIPEGTAKSHASRGLATLRVRMEEEMGARRPEVVNA